MVPSDEQGSAAPPDWRSALGVAAHGHLEPRSFSEADDALTRASGRRHTPLALQFDVRQTSRRSGGRWQHTTATTVAAEQGATVDIRIAVRPVVLSSAGRWTTAKVGWGALHYQINRLGLDEEQVRWFSQFSALNRATQGVYLGQDQERLILDDFSSPLLWHLFDEAARIGIALVGTKKNSVVLVGRHAEVRRDAAAQEDGGIVLRTAVGIDDRTLATTGVGTIGDHGLYRVEWSPAAQIALAPITGRLDPERLRALRHPESLVPAAETDEFLTEFYPMLRESVPIGSDDGSVRFPEIHPPILVLTARYDDDGVDLGWHWEHRVGDTTTSTPVARNAAAGAAGQALWPRRDPDAESAILERVGRALASHGVVIGHEVHLTGIEAADFTEGALTVAADCDDLRLDVIGSIPDYRELTERPTLTISTVETDDADWFDLGVLVHVNGRVIPFGPLFTALSTGRTRLLLVDKTYLSLKQPVFDRLRELIDEAKALSEWETGLRISRHQSALWADFEDLADETAPAVSWRAAVSGVLEVMEHAADEVAPEPLPAGLRAELRPYQRRGYDWLSFLWSHGLGGILADDMGLGKTVQALALICHAADARATAGEPPPRFLVVAPTSVVSNWKAEAERFTPGLTVTTVRSTEAKAATPFAELWRDADVVVTSYTLFRLDFAAYQAADWAGLILDEAQFVKNRTAQAHQNARDLHAPFKLAITGTPMENNVMELWALFSIVAPGLFASGRRFTEEYLRPLQHAGSRDDSDAVTDRLRRRIRPLMLRRTKNLVAPELPEKQEQVIHVELSDAHRELYDTFLQRERQKLFGLIDDLDRNRFIVFRSLTLLRMLSLDASLIDDAYRGVPSSKLDVLLEQLDDVIIEGHRALVFSQFTSFLAIAADRLTAAGIDYVMLDGTTNRRDEVIERFRSGSAPVFLISLKAGGFGLNLTEADYVFLLDPWWNPAAEAQAIDRTHRIGQDKPVMVYRLVATGTIEEKVMQLKEKKTRLFDALMNDDASAGAALTAADIRGLLAG